MYTKLRDGTSRVIGLAVGTMCPPAPFEPLQASRWRARSSASAFENSPVNDLPGPGCRGWGVGVGV